MLWEKIANFWWWTKFIVCSIATILDNLVKLVLSIFLAVVLLILGAGFYWMLWIVLKTLYLNWN